LTEDDPYGQKTFKKIGFKREDFLNWREKARVNLGIGFAENDDNKVFYAETFEEALGYACLI
jgi:hypothetical protein